MAETLGTLIDKLTIANIRLWHLEDIRRDLSLPDAKRLAAADKIAVVNGERNDLMDEIDEFLHKALRGKAKIKAPKVKIYRDFTPREEKQAGVKKQSRKKSEAKPGKKPS